MHQSGSRRIGCSAVVAHSVSYRCLICFGHVLQAILLLSAADAQKLRPDVVSFSVAISSCERAAGWQHALLLLGELGIRRLHANIITYSAAISACEKAILEGFKFMVEGARIRFWPACLAVLCRSRSGGRQSVCWPSSGRSTCSRTW